MAKSIAAFLNEISAIGYSLFPEVIPQGLLAKRRGKISVRQEVCRKWQKKNGPKQRIEESAHHVADGGERLN